MTQVAFQPGDATWTAMRERGKHDLYYLADQILGYGSKIPMRPHAHAMLCRLLEGRTGIPELDRCLVTKLLLPRGWGKTSIGTIARPIQILIQNPEASILICNEREQNAKDFLAEIKHHFEHNDLFRALYPELIPPSWQDTQWSGTRITVNRESGRKEPSVFVIGVGGTVTGMHPDHIVVDDMISREASENARRGSWQIMEEVNRWTHTLEALLSQSKTVGPRMTIIGTRWFFNDSYDHVDQYFGAERERVDYLVTAPVGMSIKQTLPVTRIGDLVIFQRSAIEDGRSAFPEKWSLDDLARLQLGDPILFSANYLNNPSSEATATFKGDWLKPYQWLDHHTIQYVTSGGIKTSVQLEQLDTVVLVDPGGFSIHNTEDRARGAVVVVGHTPTGEYLILDTWSEKDTYVVCQQQVVARAKRHKARKVGCEVAGQQIVFYDGLRRMLAEANLLVVTEPLKTDGKNKDDRILQLEPYFQRGLVYIGSGAVFAEFRAQYTQFPRSARRDLLDALAYLPKVLRHRPLLPPGQAVNQVESRRRAELTAYYQRRGLPPPPHALVPEGGATV